MAWAPNLGGYLLLENIMRGSSLGRKLLIVVPFSVECECKLRTIMAIVRMRRNMLVKPTSNDEGIECVGR